jgi:hypothetical protein
MRQCRNPRCHETFVPKKRYHYWCSWDCRVADVGNDYRGYQREREQQYDRGFWDGTRARPSATTTMPPHIWKALAVLAHPDRWQTEPGLLDLSHEAMVWLNTHRPLDHERN